MYDDQSAFIFMPFASEIEVEPVFAFKWGSVPCTFDPATRVIVAADSAVEGDPRLHSWLQSIFG
jgi:hypothetical protein